MSDRPLDQVESAAVLQPLLDEAIGSGRRKGRFRPPPEAAYQAYAADLKMRHRVMSAVICIAIFNLGIFIDHAAQPHLFWQFLFLRLVLASLPCLALVWYSRDLNPSWLRDWVSGAGLVWIGLSINIIVSLRDAPPAHLLFSLGLLIIVTNSVFQLRTAVAATVSGLIIVMAAGFLWWKAPAMTHPDLLSLAFLFAASLVTLVANHRLEATLRHLYLLMLREQLRSSSVEKVNQELSTMSLTDALTGIANRRRFDQDFDSAVRHAQESGADLSLLLVDVDHFKRYNDSWGHPAGDACLRQVASIIADEIRHADDLTARIGGEEFAVVLHNTGKAAACDVALRIHRALQAKWPAALSSVTVSIGLATLNEGHSAQEVLMAADRALYDAKEQGRNRTIAAALAA
ncbi:sensor domain-containing diguanylate cyclase [Rhizobium sp. SSA_523]|uniref:GGDEF domain-containing protein n=1 Tax=Rhizobium sp. SSA_523 TaxID=2952477 RepID=UPI0020903B35|nr:sensor domain-containing diguanylate cyclase [Rhizobium sp. SSA_523]MCO5730180.1 diguanylate cyclase [Rhizobium sp. SSA_523]WKC25243.1 diguanylate cyclase [Rhizobium sp. SSA_523]